jgi:AcrR family transcriptional regulator
MRLTEKDRIDKENQTRGRILQAAEQVFRNYGFYKTNVADIAAALAMSPANIYRFYKNKQAIHEALTAHMLAEVEAELMTVAEQDTPADIRLENFITRLQALTVERYISEQKVHDMVIAAMAENWDVIQQHIDRTMLMMGKIIEDGIKQGVFPAQDVTGVVLCIHAATASFAHPTLVAECMAQGPGALEAQARLVAHFVITALRVGFMPDPALVAAALGSKPA